MPATLDLDQFRKMRADDLAKLFDGEDQQAGVEKLMAQAGLALPGTHGRVTEYNGQRVQPVVVWRNPGTPAERAVTYFFLTS